MATNDWSHRMLMNEPIFATFLANGEDLSDERHVVHYFYDGDVEGLSSALAAEGYAVSPTATDPGIVAENHAVTDRAWSETTMKLLCDLANQYGAEYDGWEASMVRQAAKKPKIPTGFLSKLFGKKN